MTNNSAGREWWSGIACAENASRYRSN